MFGTRRLGIATLGAVALSLLLALPALAGGWVNVTLDTVPTSAQAGTPLTLGFMVRQHGVTPINSVQPTLQARNAATGETLRAVARQEGAVGHYVVDLTFPSGGDWQWSVLPEPFAEVALGSVTILPAGAAAPAPDQPRPLASDAFATLRDTARWLGLAALLVALALALWSQRGGGRWTVDRGQKTDPLTH